MKRYIDGFHMAFGMFLSIPLPTCKWEEKSSNLILPIFPLLGFIVGGIWYGLALAMRWFELSTMMNSALLMIIPYALTGFLHLDGFMDTSDAVLSRRDVQEKRRILKDPHTGAFGVISVVLLFILSFASFGDFVVKNINPMILIFIPVFSRALGSLSLLLVGTMPGSQYGAFFKKESKHIHKLFIIFVLTISIAGSFLVLGSLMLAPLLAIVISFSFSIYATVKSMGGISGDLTGFAIVVSEASALMALAIFNR